MLELVLERAHRCQHTTLHTTHDTPPKILFCSPFSHLSSLRYICLSTLVSPSCPSVPFPSLPLTSLAHPSPGISSSSTTTSSSPSYYKW